MRALRLVAAGWSILLPGIVLAQSATFDMATTTSIGGRPSAIVIDDLDHDGHVDIISANSDSASISVMFGDGTGQLLYGGQYAAGPAPMGLVIDDFDGDGTKDAIVSNTNVSALSFLKGSADGSFDPPADPPIALPGLCTGDATMACDPSVRLDPCQVAGKGTCPSTHVCTGDPAMACDPSILVDDCGAAGKGTCDGVGGPGAIAAGDLNGDSFPDLAVASEGSGEGDGKLSILFGAGGGTFTTGAPRPAGFRTKAVVIADFNNDGSNDVAVANNANDTIAVFLGDGHGNFGQRLDSALPSATAPTGLAVGDVDENGNLDLVVSGADGITVMLGDGQGHFTSGGVFAAGNFPSGIALADLNDDEHLDAVVSNSRSADVSILLGDSHGRFGNTHTFVADGEPLAVAVGDLNEDGHLDVVSANQADAGPDLAVLLNRGCSPAPCRSDGRLIGVEDLAADAEVTAVASGDFNNDSLPDLAATVTGNTVRIFLARAAGGFITAGEIAVGQNPGAVAVGDFNRDGNLDLVTVNTAGSNVSLLLGHGNGAFNAAQQFATAAEPSTCVVGDFDNNGIPDVAVASIGYPGVVSILLGQPDGRLGEFFTYPVGDTATAVAVGHFNGDAFQDLAVANSGSNSISILLGNGNGTFTAGTAVAVGRGPSGLAVLDADRNGSDDLAVVHATDQNIWICNGSGSGTFTCTQPPISAGHSPKGIAARAFAGPRSSGAVVPDLAVSNSTSNSVSMLVNNATGRFTHKPPDIIVSRKPEIITGADFDGDGRYDVATGNSFNTSLNVSVLHNHGATPVLRGDGNGDGRVGAADLIAAQIELVNVRSGRAEDATLGGKATPGVDANGDGVITPQDPRATATRIFIGS